MMNSNVVPLIRNEWYFTALNGIDGESFTGARELNPDEPTTFQPINKDIPIDNLPDFKLLSYIFICVLITIENTVLVGAGLTREGAKTAAIQEYKIL